MNRNLWAVLAATTAVIVVLILGFRFLGSPRSQRMVQADLKIVRMLAELAQQINYKWSSSNKTLPSSLEGFPKSMTQDPITSKAFGYKPKADSKYELCATFATNNRDLQNNDPNVHWTHPKGDYCFEFDAAQPVPMVPYYY